MTLVSRPASTLAELPLRTPAVVAGVDALRLGTNVARRLAELGFLPGESVAVMARVPGGGPLAVRIGSSTFALRCEEAACIDLIGAC